MLASYKTPTLVIAVGLISFGLGWLVKSLPQDSQGAGPSAQPALRGKEDSAELTEATSVPERASSSVSTGLETPAQTARLVRDLPYREGGGRAGKQIFLDWWGDDLAGAGFGPEGPTWLKDKPAPQDVWNGPLGDVDLCLEYYRGLFESAIDAKPGPLNLRAIGSFEFSHHCSEDPSSLLAELLNSREFMQDHSQGKPDRDSPQWSLALEMAQADSQALCALLEGVRDAMRVAVREDLAGLSRYKLPNKGYLNFGPCNVNVHPLAASRICREPRAAWCSDFMRIKDNEASMCRVFVAVYTVFWEDFPEVASKIQAALEFRDGFRDRIAPFLSAIPWV
jgi:hypothetical protein